MRRGRHVAGISSWQRALATSVAVTFGLTTAFEWPARSAFPQPAQHCPGSHAATTGGHRRPPHPAGARAATSADRALPRPATDVDADGRNLSARGGAGPALARAG